ncbi:MAG: hypothetical protein LBB11_03740 [Puniceicoccales bacterium]|jgi:hypothetical protein|nr:hypothetical protein [Puniceicoccales bacterium]
MNWLTENLMEIVLWSCATLALVGSYYNATARYKLSYVLWLIIDLFFIWHNYRIGEKQQCALYVFYFIIAIIGLKNTIHHKGWLLSANKG